MLRFDNMMRKKNPYTPFNLFSNLLRVTHSEKEPIEKTKMEELFFWNESS